MPCTIKCPQNKYTMGPPHKKEVWHNPTFTLSNLALSPFNDGAQAHAHGVQLQQQLLATKSAAYEPDLLILLIELSSHSHQMCSISRKNIHSEEPFVISAAMARNSLSW